MNLAQTTESHDLRASLAELARDAVPGRDCPPAETLWLARCGELASTAMREVVDHLSTCAVCGEAWDLAGDLQDEAAMQLRHESESAPVETASSTRRVAWLVAATVALLAIALPLLWQPEPSIPRGGGERLTSLLPKAPLAREDVELRWSPLEGARYDLRVTHLGPAGEIVLAQVQALETASYRLPASQLEAVPSGGSFQWQVTAKRGDDIVDQRAFSSRLR